MLAMCSSSVTSTPGNTLEKGEIAAASTTASTRGGTPLRVLVAGVAVLCQVEHGSTARNEGQAERVVKKSLSQLFLGQVPRNPRRSFL